jgi:hypothetical protein
VPLKRRLDGIARERCERLSRIEQLRGAHVTAGRFLDDASQLLTGSRWSRASCTTREELLRTADWLIDLARAARLGADPRKGAESCRPESRAEEGLPLGQMHLARVFT